MLSTEHQIQIGDYTLYRDLQDESKYYYLPSDKVRIADKGKKIQFTAYFDGEIQEGARPSFDEDINTSGGFLNLEVELGPDKDELDKIATELKSKVGGEVHLAPVMFDKGAVRLMIFGESSGEPQKKVESNEPVNKAEDGEDSEAAEAVEAAEDTTETVVSQARRVTLVGSAVPSLIGRQTGAFNLRLSGMDAQIMWDLLENTTQTQVAVMYDLEFKGIMPAYYMKVTVDYNKVDTYWEHYFEAGLDFSYDSSNSTSGKNDQDKKRNKDKGLTVAVAAEADVDVMMRDLLKEGAIEVVQIDYLGNGTGSPLGAEDPTAMNLVKQLLSAEFFEFTPKATDDIRILKGKEEKDAKAKEAEKEEKAKEAVTKLAASAAEVTKKDQTAAAEIGKKKTDADAEKGKSGDEEKGKIGNEGNEDKEKGKNADANKAQKTKKTVADREEDYITEETDETADVPVYPEYENLKKDAKGNITLEIWKEAGLPEEEFKKLVKKLDGEEEEEVVDKDKYAEFRKGKEEIRSRETPPPDDDNDDDDKDDEEEGNEENGGDGGNGEDGKDEEATLDKVQSVNIKADIDLCYSYKKRTEKEHGKRSYIFNKQQVQTFEYHPSGALERGSQFNKANQLRIVRLGEGPFKNVEVTILSGLDFDQYHLEKIIVELSHDRTKVGGSILKDTVVLTKEVSSCKRTIPSPELGSGKIGVDYTVSFVFDGKAKFIGFGQEMDTVFVSERKGVTSNTILIDKSYLDNLIPVEIRTGTIAFDNGVSATSVYFEREDERHTELAEFTVKSATQPLTVFMNPEVSYRTRLAYAIPTQMYLNTPTNKNAVSIVSNATESNDVVINQPAKGIHKIYPVYGELTFSMGVEGIIVNLKQGEKKLTPIPLMKSKPAVCLLVDYEPGEPQEIQVESVTVIRKDETGRITQEPFTPSQTVLRPEDTELVLDIF